MGSTPLTKVMDIKKQPEAIWLLSAKKSTIKFR